ncbi:MAG: hypothetical protein ACFFDQ_13400 [Candidatus Thorarchaeota archaeon]
MSRIELVKSRFSKTVEKEVEEWSTVPAVEIPTSFAIIVVFGLIVAYFAAHLICLT